MFEFAAVLSEHSVQRLGLRHGARKAVEDEAGGAIRFAAYRNQTAPILPYYRARGILRSVDGMAPIDEVTRQIEAVLRSAGR